MKAQAKKVKQQEARKIVEKKKPVEKPQLMEEPKVQPVVRPPTDAQRYTDRLAKLGSVLIMADCLGVAPITLARRCNDTSPITREMWLALAGVEAERAQPKEQ